MPAIRSRTRSSTSHPTRSSSGTVTPSRSLTIAWRVPRSTRHTLGGVVGLLAGASYSSKAHSDYDSAEHATDYATHHSLVHSGDSAQTISIVASAAGTVLVIGAVVRYVMSDRSAEPAAVGV